MIYKDKQAVFLLFLSVLEKIPDGISCPRQMSLHGSLTILPEYKCNYAIQYETSRKEIQRCAITARCLAKPGNNGWTRYTCQTPGGKDTPMDGTELARPKDIAQISWHTGKTTAITADNQQHQRLKQNSIRCRSQLPKSCNFNKEK